MLQDTIHALQLIRLVAGVTMLGTGVTRLSTVFTRHILHVSKTRYMYSKHVTIVTRHVLCVNYDTLKKFFGRFKVERS